ncbi:MAG: leucine-rich repeat domain-containing protein, partial [Clostridia bacterium]|nr:leucine-rich repeat domain-containing protein [Clostridia bacterium]
AGVDVIGDRAFASSGVAAVTLKDGVNIGNGAFLNCASVTATDLSKAAEIGDDAFRNTAISSAVLTNATKIGSYAFANTLLTEVTLGKDLVTLGENPFFGCNIATFGKAEDIMFNGIKVGQNVVEDIDVSDGVKVIGGALYSVTSKGLQLISYPIGKSEGSFTVADGTVRIGARACEGAQFSAVTLPAALTAIGDKAFYGCDYLSTVIFTGYYAPLFEEEFDEAYFTADNYPYVSDWNGKGLEISKYDILNVSTNFNAVYFGANFVDHIGHIDRTVVAVRPANGENYDSFVMKLYFGKIVSGANAATNDALQVIALIRALPDAKNITLENESAVNYARNAYNSLPNNEQKAIVDNATGSKLVESENIIEYLKNLSDSGNTPQDSSESNAENSFGKFMKNNLVGFIVAAAVAVAFVVYVVLSQKKAKTAAGDSETETPSTEETAETSSDSEEAENADDEISEETDGETAESDISDETDDLQK